MHWGHFFGGQLTCTFPFCVIIFIGYFFARLGAITYDGSIVLAKLCIDIFIPCYLFIHICKSTTTDYLQDNGAVIVSILVIMVFAFTITYIYAVITNVDVRYKWTFIALATISEVKYMNYLSVHSFCYHIEEAHDYNPTELSYCEHLEDTNYSHMFFQSLLAWYVFYFAIRKDREHWRTIVDVGRDIAKAYETELIIDDSSSSDEEEELEYQRSLRKSINTQNKKEIKEEPKESERAEIVNKELNMQEIELKVKSENIESNKLNNSHNNDNKINNMNENENDNKLNHSHSNRKIKEQKEKALEIKRIKKEEEAQMKKIKQDMYDEFEGHMAVAKDTSSLHASPDFLDKVQCYYDSYLHKHKSEIKPWWYKLSYVMFGPCQIALWTGFIVGFITVIRDWTFNTTGAQFIFYETINSIANTHLVVNYLLIGANFFIFKQHEYSFRFRKQDHVALLILKCIILPFLGLLYVFIAKEVDDTNKAALFNAYLQWISPSSIDVITMVQAKEINTTDCCINTALQWVWFTVVSTFAVNAPMLKILGY